VPEEVRQGVEAMAAIAPAIYHTAPFRSSGLMAPQARLASLAVLDPAAHRSRNL
jgi:hypothetical protein